MHKKPTAQTTSTRTTESVTAAEMRTVLARGPSRLAADEEKVLRMRHGLGAPREMVLEQMGQEHPETRSRLLGLELELLRQSRERQAEALTRPGSMAAAAAPEHDTARRDKIVRALRRKG